MGAYLTFRVAFATDEFSCRVSETPRDLLDATLVKLFLTFGVGLL